MQVRVLALSLVLMLAASLAVARWAPDRPPARPADEILSPCINFWASPFGEPDVTRLKRLASLNADQTAAAYDILDAAQRELAMARRRLLIAYERLIEERPDVEKDAASRAAAKPLLTRFLRAREEVERNYLTELKLLVPDGATRAWDEFLIARRGAIPELRESVPWPTVEQVIERSDLDPQQRRLAESALQQYRDDITPAVSGLLTDIGQFRRAGEMRWLFDEPEPDAEAFQARTIAASRRIRDVVDRGVKSACAALPSDVAARLMTTYETERTLRIGRVQRAEQDNTVREVLTVSTITPEQRQRVRALVRRANTDLGRVYREIADQRAECLLGDPQAEERASHLLDAAQKAANAVFRELREKSRAVLTPDQRRAFDDGSEPPLRPDRRGPEPLPLELEDEP